MNLADLARKEADLPYDAPVGDILRSADEVEAFIVGEQGLNLDMPTRLLTRYARRLSAGTPANLAAARMVLALAAAGHHAAEVAKASTAAYRVAYEQVRVAVDAGVTQSEAARISGLDRMTVRKAIGRPRVRKTTPPRTSTGPVYQREDIIMESEAAADNLFDIGAQADEGIDLVLDGDVDFALVLAEQNEGARF